MYLIILAFLTAFALTFFAIPSIIVVARKKKLYDNPEDERRVHKEITPSLGGIGIFAGMIFSITFWTPFSVFSDLQYVLCAFIIMFLVGAKDDIIEVSAKRKLQAQVFAAIILVFKANVHFTSFYGALGITDINIYFSYAISIFLIIVIMNALNLIDGINTLSGGIAIMIAATFGTWFFITDNIELSIVAYALGGASLGFLYYNITPAKIFMGDTGSLLLGLVSSILFIRFMELNFQYKSSPEEFSNYLKYTFEAGPVIAVSVLILPFFDTLRVFSIRILSGKSPFMPDKNHIHHLLLDLNLSHLQASGFLIGTNILMIGIAYFLQPLGIALGIFCLILIALFFSWLLHKKARPNTSLIQK